MAVELHIIAALPNLTVRIVPSDRFSKTALRFTGWEADYSYFVSVTCEELEQVYTKAVLFEHEGMADGVGERDTLFAIDAHNVVRVVQHHMFGVDVRFSGFSNGHTYKFTLLPEFLREILDIAAHVSIITDAVPVVGGDNLPF